VAASGAFFGVTLIFMANEMQKVRALRLCVYFYFSLMLAYGRRRRIYGEGGTWGAWGGALALGHSWPLPPCCPAPPPERGHPPLAKDVNTHTHRLQHNWGARSARRPCLCALKCISQVRNS
jgi:hypothetical protein